jgi:tetratricopeptide (TPR) repeat protein
VKYFVVIGISFFLQSVATAQPANNYIQKGNDAYHKGDFTAAVENYKNALRKEPENNTARFNLANALQKQNETEESKKNYDEIISKEGLTSMKAESQYNKALAFIKEKNLLNAITAFKESLKQNPSDNDARENLQKALNDLKKQQEQNQQKKQKPQQQNQQKEKKQPPLNKQMMEQKFNELRNQEKQLQKKLQSKTESGQPEKDW